MDPTHDPLAQSLAGASSSSATAAWGELVVQNTRLSGTRRLLDTPFLLVGQAEGCDVRLNAQGVSPAHCALLQTPLGPVLRDLQSKSGTFLNGELVTQATVRAGDELSVGPFRFLIHLMPQRTSAPARADDRAESASDRREREALRIQAAAVAAQQAALTEEEVRLQQRRQALEQQEAQLAAHLEEKRRRLVEVRNKAQEAHAALRAERDAHDKHLVDTARELAVVRAETIDSQRQAQTERRRLLTLRQRLRQRLHRHWAAERAAMRRREDQLAHLRLDIDKEAEAVQREKQEMYRARLRVNGEIELGRRKLQDAWNQLRLEQQQWEERQGREQAQAQDRSRLLDQREVDLLDAEHELAEQRRREEARRLELERESEGLENRVRNQRRKLLEQDEERKAEDARRDTLKETAGEATGDDSALADGSSGHATALTARERRVREAEQGLQHRLAALEKMSGELADQRLYLAEQCQRLLQARQRSQEERAAAAADLELLARRFQERERTLLEQEQALARRVEAGRHCHEELVQQRQHLDAWQARLTVRAAAWEGERKRLLSDLRGREEQAEQHLTAVADLRKRWQLRRRQETERLQGVLAVCEKFRQECAVLREGWLKRSDMLEQERRELAERSLALEEYRQETLDKAADTTEADQRLDRLRQRWAAEFQTATEPLTRESQQLARAGAAIEERFGRLRDDLDGIARREAELSKRETDLEAAHAKAETDQTRLSQELHALRSQTSVYERQLRDLNDEVERLARTLLDADDPGTLPMKQAA